LVHKIEPAQIAWLHAASKRFAQGALSGCAQRSAAVVVLIPNNTVTRLAGGVWIDASAVRDVDVLTRSRVQYLERADLITKIIATVKDMEHTNETQ
jgi:Mg2+/Co2+ transporter CorC